MRPHRIDRGKQGVDSDMAIRFPPPRHARLMLAMMVLLLAVGARAEDPPHPPQQQPAAVPSGQKSGASGGRASTPNPPAAAEPHRLPPDSTTRQTLALPGRTLDFAATAGSIRLFDDKGEPQADIAYTSYQLDGADARSRPVTFLFNGGPGAAAAHFQLRNTGPWRPPPAPAAPTPSPQPRPSTRAA